MYVKIVASFASHLHRVQQVAREAIAAGRRVAFLGRSMTQNVTLAREMGLLDLPADRVIDADEVSRYAPGEVCIICTGSPLPHVVMPQRRHSAGPHTASHDPQNSGVIPW